MALAEHIAAAVDFLEEQLRLASGAPAGDLPDAATRPAPAANRASAAPQTSAPAHPALDPPAVALILGSGLGDLADHLDLECAVDYAAIPHFQISTAPGHRGRLLFGNLAGQRVVCMQGRLHYYEGYSPAQIVFPLQVMQALGARRLIVTNAAGAINPAFAAGEIMNITDQINFTGAHPLTLSAEHGLDDCVDMSYSYTPALCQLATEVAQAQGLTLRQGVYLGVRGPSFETPAEVRAFRIWGADAVGMSTIFEVIQAVQLGMEVLGFSLLTNMAAGMTAQRLAGDDVLRVSAVAADTMERLVVGVLAKLPEASN